MKKVCYLLLTVSLLFISFKSNATSFCISSTQTSVDSWINKVNSVYDGQFFNGAPFVRYVRSTPSGSTVFDWEPLSNSIMSTGFGTGLGISYYDIQVQYFKIRPDGSRGPATSPLFTPTGC